METDKKTVLKVVRLPNDSKCVIVKRDHSEDDLYFEEVEYCYERCGSLEFKICMSCFSDEDGDRYSVDIGYPNEENLMRDAKDEMAAIAVLNGHLLHKDKVPALGRFMSVR